MSAEQMQEAVVKPLEWRPCMRAGSYTAHGLGIIYAIDTDHDCAVLAKWEGSSVLKSAHETADAAKAFAQDAEEVRVRSALVVPPAPSQERIAQLGRALEWYAEQARAAAKYIASDKHPHALEAILTALAFDGGSRAALGAQPLDERIEPDQRRMDEITHGLREEDLP